MIVGVGEGFVSYIYIVLFPRYTTMLALCSSSCVREGNPRPPIDGLCVRSPGRAYGLCWQKGNSSLELASSGKSYWVNKGQIVCGIVYGPGT